MANGNGKRARREIGGNRHTLKKHRPKKKKFGRFEPNKNKL